MNNFLSDDFKKLDNFSCLFNTECGRIKYLYDNIQKFSLTSYYYLFKGLQYELALFKKVNIDKALEYYHTGGNSSNHLCYFRIYLIHYKCYEQNNKELNPTIISDNESQIEHGLFYLLKCLSYFDKSSFLNFLISDLAILQKIVKENYDKIKSYLNNKINRITITQKEIDFLNINLNRISNLEEVETFDSLIKLYKTSQYEESLYQIFVYLIRSNQEVNVEKMVNENFLFNSSYKIYPLLIDYSGLFGNKPQVEELIIYILNNLDEYKRKLKTGGHFYQLAQLNSINVNLEAEESKKLTKYLFRAFVSGDPNSVVPLFYLSSNFGHNLDLTNETLDYLFAYLNEKSHNYLGDNLFYQFQFLLALFYLKGIKTAKDVTKSISIFESILSKTEVDLNLEIKIVYYLIKANEYLLEQSQVVKYKHYFLDRLTFSLLNKTSVESNFLIAKFLMNEGNSKQSFEILNSLLQDNCVHVEEKSRATNYPSIVKKVFLSKIKRFINKKELSYFKENETKCFSMMNDVEEDLCFFCNVNLREVLGVPCGHKFICINCYEQNEPNLFFGPIIKCPKCNSKLEAGLKKIFN